ncbi:MAG: arginyltransferase [Raineya sp.]
MYYISEDIYVEQISPRELDTMLAKAWRRFGHIFFRYNQGFIEEREEYSGIMPLRIRLADFDFSKSQKKILKKNSLFILEKGLIEVDFEKIRLFQLHCQRFRHSRPHSIYQFISHRAEKMPIPTYEVRVYDQKKLIAASFVDIGELSFSSIYAIFDPQYSKYSLGNYTLFEEILWAKELGKQYLYLGYAHQAPSFYDYKKKFSALEQYIWEEDCWVPFHSSTKVF